MSIRKQKKVTKRVAAAFRLSFARLFQAQCWGIFIEKMNGAGCIIDNTIRIRPMYLLWRLQQELIEKV